MERVREHNFHFRILAEKMFFLNPGRGSTPPRPPAPPPPLLCPPPLRPRAAREVLLQRGAAGNQLRKGEIISLEISQFPKYYFKNPTDFCPRHHEPLLPVRLPHGGGGSGDNPGIMLRGQQSPGGADINQTIISPMYKISFF